MTASPEFDAALAEFKMTLKPEELAAFRITKLEDVKAEIGRIEQLNERDRLQRGLRRINPFIEGLQRYAGVIEVFIQVKPDVLALIWGPIKFILEATHGVLHAFDTTLDAFRDIRECLPRLDDFGKVFGKSSRIERVLVLVYKNILEFYCQVLEVVRKKKWKQFFDFFWTGRSSRLAQLLENIRHSRDLVDIEASAASIFSAHQFFTTARSSFEEESKHRKDQMFQAAETWLDPLRFEDDFERFEEVLDSSRGSGAWLMSHPDFENWASSNGSPVLWLSGIPGSGKTILSYTIWSQIHEKITAKEAALVLFISDEQNSARQGTLSAVIILKTIIFQLLAADQDTLLPIITAHIDKATTNIKNKTRKSIESLLYELFEATDLSQIVLMLDGLDEMIVGERELLLRYVLSLRDRSTKMSVNLKLFTSCRSYPDIKAHLSSYPTIDVNDYNVNDIHQYATTASSALQLKYRISEQKSMDLLNYISSRSGGMFLYCRLMIYTLIHQPNRSKLESAAANLPQGLQAAYARIIRDIHNLEEQEKVIAISILQLLICCKSNVSVLHIERIVGIEAGDKGFDSDKFLLTTVEDLFGPLLEVRRGYLHFVHFSAKEFLETKECEIKIDKLSSHYNMALRNLVYLNFDCFDPALSKQEITDLILTGDYLWVRYAQETWLEHASIGSQAELLDMTDLYREIDAFYDRWWYPEGESEDCIAMIAAQGASMLKGFPKATDKLKKRLGYTLFYNSQLRNTQRTDVPQPLSICAFLNRV